MSSQFENQDINKTEMSFFNRFIYILREFQEYIKYIFNSVFNELERHKSFELYTIYILISLLSFATSIKWDWIYFTVISLKVLINANFIGFAPLVIIISLYIFLDVFFYFAIPVTILTELLDISIPYILYYSMKYLGLIKEFKFQYSYFIFFGFLTIQISIWIGYLIKPILPLITLLIITIFSPDSSYKTDLLLNYKTYFYSIFMMEENINFGKGMLGILKYWKFKVNKVLAAHCTTFLIFLIIIYGFNTIKSNFELICSMIGIIIPRSPVLTIKDLTENSVELYWYEPKEQKKSIFDIKLSYITKQISKMVLFPFRKFKNISSESDTDADNTLSDYLRISKQNGEDTYRFDLSNNNNNNNNSNNKKDTNNNKLKFPKSTSTTNFTTTHYEINSSDTDLMYINSDSQQSLITDNDENKENKSDNIEVKNKNIQLENDKNKNNDDKNDKKNSSKIGFVLKKGKDDKDVDIKSSKILVDGKEVDIKNFADEIKKEIQHLEGHITNKTRNESTGIKSFLYKYGFYKRNEITYQVEVNGYILNDENLKEKHIIIHGLKPATSYKIRIWSIMNNRIKSPSSFVNVQTLRSYSETLNKTKVTKTSTNTNINNDEKVEESYEDHLKTIAKIDNDINEINQEFEKLKKQRLEFNKQVNDINEQYKEEEIPLRKQLDELKLEKNQVDEDKLQHKGVLKELKEEKRRIDLIKSQREQGLKTKERGKQQLIDRCNRCQSDINKLQKDIQRLEEKEESFDLVYDKAKKEYNEEKEKVMKEQNQLKDKLKEEKKHHKQLVKELNDKKSLYKQIENSRKKIIQDNRERNKEKLKVDEEYKMLSKKYRELKEKNLSLKNQLKLENKEKIKLLQDLNEIHQQSDSEEISDLDDNEVTLEHVDSSISDDLASNSTLSKSNSDPSTNTPNYSNTNSIISRNSSEENTLSRPSEFNLFNTIEPNNNYDNYDNQYSKSSKTSSPKSNKNVYNRKNKSNNNNNNNNHKKGNPIKSRFYSYPLESQNSFNSNFNVNTYNSNSINDPSSIYERSLLNNISKDNNLVSNDNIVNTTGGSRYGISSPRQQSKQNKNKMKDLIPFFSYNSYVPTSETTTDSQLLSTSYEDDLLSDSSKVNMNSGKPPKGVFNSSKDSAVSPLMQSLSQNNNLTKFSPNMSSGFSPKISHLSPLLLSENNALNSSSISSSNNYNSSLFSNLLKNNYNSINLTGNPGSVTSSSSLNTNSLYASINNPVSSENGKKTNGSISISNANNNNANNNNDNNNNNNNDNKNSNNNNNNNNNNNSNNLGFLFGNNLGQDQSLNSFTNSSIQHENSFNSPMTNHAKLNGNDSTDNNITINATFSPIVSPQVKNTSLMSGFSTLPSYYQNLNLSNDVNDILGTSKNPLDSLRATIDNNQDSKDIENLTSINSNTNNAHKTNSFGSNTSSHSNYLFNNYFSFSDYTKKSSSESSKDNYLHDYLNSRLAGYSSFYNQPMFNSSLTGSYFNEPSTGTYGSMNSLNNSSTQQNSNDIDDKDIDLNFTYNLELSSSESEDVDTSDIDISKIIDLSSKKK